MLGKQRGSALSFFPICDATGQFFSFSFHVHFSLFCTGLLELWDDELHVVLCRDDVDARIGGEGCKVLVCLRDVWLPLWTVGVAVMYVAVALAIIAMLGYARAYLIQGRNDRTQKPDEANK